MDNKTYYAYLDKITEPFNDILEGGQAPLKDIIEAYESNNKEAFFNYQSQSAMGSLFYIIQGAFDYGYNVSKKNTNKRELDNILNSTLLAIYNELIYIKKGYTPIIVVPDQEFTPAGPGINYSEFNLDNNSGATQEFKDLINALKMDFKAV